MSARAIALADRFEIESGRVSARIAACSDEELRRLCPPEACNVIALACHVARIHNVTVAWISDLLGGESLASVSMAEIDHNNERWAREDAGRTKADALHLLESNRRAASAFVRSLSDQDLDTTGSFGPFNGAEVSVQTLIERILIGDPVHHLQSIETALADNTANQAL